MTFRRESSVQTNNQLLKLAQLDSAHFIINNPKYDLQNYDLHNYDLHHEINIGFISPDFYNRPSGLLMKNLFKYFVDKKYKTFLFSRLETPNDIIREELEKYANVSIELKNESAENCAAIIKKNNTQ